MCAVLSQAKNHEEAIKHAKIASYICEDNIHKTFLLCNQINHDFDKNLKNVSPKEKNEFGTTKKKNFFEKEVFHAFKEKNTEADKVLGSLFMKLNDYKAKSNLNKKQM